MEVRQRKAGTKLDKRKGGRYAGRVRLAIVPDRSAESLCGFVECAVVPGTSLVTDDWSGYASLAKRGYKHLAIAERGDPQVAEEYLPIIHLVFANLKTWLNGIHHGVSHQHLQAYLNEFTFRFNRRFYPFKRWVGVSGSVVEAWVSLRRFSPPKPQHRRPGLVVFDFRTCRGLIILMADRFSQAAASINLGSLMRS